MDEVECTDTFGSRRRADIIAFDPKNQKAYIIDPTVRYEKNDDMDQLVQTEKEAIYGACIPDLQARYTPTLGAREYEVIGVWLGARGTVGKNLLNLFRRFGLPMNRIPELAERVLTDSIRMIHQHIYS